MRGIGEGADPGDSLDVLPCLSELDLGHHVLSDAERGAEFALEHQPPLRANVGDVILGETILPVIDALGGAIPAAGHPVGVVVPLRPECEVSWIAARGIVARVTCLEPFRYVPVGHTIGDAVGAFVDSAESGAPVAFASGTGPRPAFVGSAYAYQVPKSTELVRVTPSTRHAQYSAMAAQ